MKKKDLQFFLIVILLLMAIPYSRTLTRSELIPLAKDLSLFPKRIDQWVGEDYPFEPAVIQNMGADEILNRAYVHPDGEVIWFYVGYYKSQKTRAQIHSPLHCYPGSGWNPVLKEVVTIHLRDRDIYINRMIIQNGAEKQMVAYWYQAQEKVIADEFIQRLNLILTSFRKHRTDGSLVRISTTLHDNMPEEDWKRIVSFIQAMYPQFIASIPQ